MMKDNFETWLTEIFFWFHAHPELSYEEFETTKRIKKILSEEKISVLDLPLETGLVAKIGSAENPCIALRCDIDALPIEEQTDLPYKSLTAGKMHACGHDFHISAVLGAAHLLKKIESELNGTILLIFQPAEEAPGGAKKILETGALDGVQKIFGLHSSPLLDVGVVGLRAGAVTASVDRFKIIFQGRGSHAAHPERGIDPIFMAAQFISSAQTIVTQNLDPSSANLVSVTHIESGNTWNVIPETAFIEGTVRSLSSSEREKIRQRIFSLAENISSAMDGSAKVEWYAGPPATQNDPSLTKFAEDTAANLNLKVVSAPISLAGEDFAYYQEKISGLFAIFGTGKSSANHSPTFRVDPASLFPAAKYLATLCRDAIKL